MNIFTIIILLLLFGCKNHNRIESQNEVKSNEETIIEIQELSSSVVVSDDKKLNQNSPDLLNIEQVRPSSYNKLRIYIKNTLIENLVISVAELDSVLPGSAFSLLENTCPESLKINKTCYLEIKMVYSDILSYSPISFKLFENAVNPWFGSFIISGTKGSAISTTKSILFTKIGQFDSMSTNQQIRLYLRNSGDTVQNPQLTVPSEYDIVNNTCMGTLKKNKACYIDLRIKNGIDPNIIGINKNLDFDGSTLAISAGANTPIGTIQCGAAHTNVLGSCEQTNQIRACSVQPDNSLNGHEETANGGQSWSTCISFDCNSSSVNVGGTCRIPNLVCSTIGSTCNNAGCSTDMTKFGIVNKTRIGSYGTDICGSLDDTFNIKLSCNISAMNAQGFSMGTTGSTQTAFPQYFNGKFLISSIHPILRSTNMNQSMIIYNNQDILDNHTTAFSSYDCVVIP